MNITDESTFLEMFPVIEEAFRDIKLEDGIGYFEANAIDNYCKPGEVVYEEEKAKDEREDWHKVLEMIESRDNYNRAVYCFMDAKGKCFFIPVLLFLCDFETLNFIFSYKEEDTKAILDLLTTKQRQCLLHCYEFEVAYDWSVNYYLNYKGSVCKQCDEIHHPVSYTKEEAIAKVENDEDYKVWQLLKKLISAAFSNT